MNSFEAMGQAQLLAAQGQRELAAALARAFHRLLRYLPASKSTPW